MSRLPPLWGHQRDGIASFFGAVRRGVRRVCLTSPTGGGKTRTVGEIVKDYLREYKKVVWYTNRKMLLEQTAEVFEAHGLTAGKRASGHFPELHHDFQISSIQTERSRTIKSDKWELHDAALAVFDEAHLMANDTAARIMAMHLDGGATILGVTATPIDLGDFYDELIVAGLQSELRKCGALVPAMHYGVEEPDLKQIGSYRVGEDLSEAKNRKVMGSVSKDDTPDEKIKALFGRVIDNWRRLNTSGGNTLLFAPGVKESLWFAMEFTKAGIPAAHIDGQEVWVGGELHRTKRGVREQVIDDFKRERIKVICNRFVMREGIDIPQVEHLVLACVIGGLQTYLQLGGRGLRAFPGKKHCVVQDHGGAWWRHLSLNMDRQWDLSFKAETYSANLIDMMREKKIKEPILCPQCKKVLTSLKCQCGFVVNPTAKTRPVVQADGSLKEQSGDIFPARQRRERPDTQKLWTQMYCRAYQGGMSFRQAEALFCREHFYWPPRTLTLMPKDTIGWGEKVNQVPTEELIGPPPGWLKGWREKRARKKETGSDAE